MRPDSAQVLREEKHASIRFLGVLFFGLPIFHSLKVARHRGSSFGCGFGDRKPCCLPSDMDHQPEEVSTEKWAPKSNQLFTYKIGQLYMISKHSHEQSDRGEGVEVVQNEPFEDPHHGNGQFTEKRVYLNSKLPSWARAVVPKIFYVTEKAWNYYPYTITEYTCSFLPKFSIHIETKYEDNKGSNNSIFDNEAKDLEREVCFIDIACDEIPERYYKESEDPKHFKSEKTGRGQLREGWRDSHQPIMCSYKLVTVKFEVWGLQTRVEQFVHKVVRDILLIGHRQAFAWVDEWYDMTMDEVREFERATQEATNKKIGVFPPAISISSIPLLPSSVRSAPSSAPSTPLSTDAPEFLSVPKDRPRKKSAPETLTLPDLEKKATLNLPGMHSSNKPCRPKSE
nr:cytoplasmic phosphatidylinositol transfer protein 1 isoform X1 [Loxodonta africana]